MLEGGLIAVAVIAVWFAVVWVRKLIEQLNNMYALFLMTVFNDSVYAQQKAGLEKYILLSEARNEQALWADFATNMTALAHDVRRTSVVLDAPRWLWAMNQEARGEQTISN